jgi:hypothetical protein
VVSDSYVRWGMAGTDLCVELGLCQPNGKISGHLLQSLVGMESPLIGVLGAGRPFSWLSSRTGSGEGPFGLRSGREDRRPRAGNVRGSLQSHRGLDSQRADCGKVEKSVHVGYLVMCSQFQRKKLLPRRSLPALFPEIATVIAYVLSLPHCMACLCEELMHGK